MRRSSLQQFLTENGIQPNKKLGQCFLVDANVSRWIVDQAEADSETTVIEVGPGAGALTDHLAGKVGRLILVEKDAKLAAHLTERFSDGIERVEVIHGDAVEFDVRPLMPDGPITLIGNLPYSVGNEILRNLLNPPSPISRAVVMVQKEVADRICAQPGTKDYGVLSLMIQERWKTRLVKTVGPQLFYPRPEVDSSIVTLLPRTVEEIAPHCPEVFAFIVRRGFSQRRKQLRKNLGVESGTWERIMSELQLATTVRAEELSLEQWVALSNLIDPHPAGLHAQSGDELFDVVDDEDQVTHQERRAVVHAKGLKHRAVHLFVFNPQGEIYLQKRSLLKDTQVGKWASSCSGHVDAGESYVTAAIRELEEELFLKAELPLEELGGLPACEGTEGEFVRIYRFDSEDSEIQIHGNEIDCGGFFPLELVDRWMEKRPEDFAPGFLSCFAAVREKLSR